MVLHTHTNTHKTHAHAYAPNILRVSFDLIFIFPSTSPNETKMTNQLYDWFEKSLLNTNIHLVFREVNSCEFWKVCWHQWSCGVTCLLLRVVKECSVRSGITRAVGTLIHSEKEKKEIKGLEVLKETGEWDTTKQKWLLGLMRRRVVMETRRDALMVQHRSTQCLP